jgi:hypothetical protein
MDGCGKEVLQVLRFSNEHWKGYKKPYELSESSGFGGTMCAGMSISWKRFTSVQNSLVGNEKNTNHYQIDYPSSILVFR